MKVTGDWLTRAAPVLAMLEGAGHRALVVGGCVRNALLDLPVADVDIATEARPETVSELAEAAGFRVVPTGLAHGTVTVVCDGTGYEVTTFRRDEETFGRHARVAFGASLEQDASRRDFTLNALYAQADGTVIDPLGGLPDVLARRLRFVDDPEARITEDALRILRFFRFYAQYGDPAEGLDADAVAACAQHSALLDTLSRERITAEMRKLLAAPDPAPSVAAMAASGVLPHALPGAMPQGLPVLVHLEEGRPGPWLRRLAVLGSAEGLRLSNAENRDFSLLRDAFSSLDTPAALGWRLGAALGTDATLGRAALLETPPPPGWQEQITRGAKAVFPVKPADLMPALQGPALGAALKRMQAHWLAEDLRPGREELLGLA